MSTEANPNTNTTTDVDSDLMKDIDAATKILCDTIRAMVRAVDNLEPPLPPRTHNVLNEALEALSEGAYAEADAKRMARLIEPLRLSIINLRALVARYRQHGSLNEH